MRLADNEHITSIVAGCIGLLAAVLVGTGEFLLHFDTMARYAGGYDFFESVSENRATLGHFIGVLGAPLYLFGVWHVAKMLQPASKFWSSVAFFVMSYGFMVGAVWIGSRSSAAALVAIGQDPAAAALRDFVDRDSDRRPGVLADLHWSHRHGANSLPALDGRVQSGCSDPRQLPGFLVAAGCRQVPDADCTQRIFLYNFRTLGFY